MYVPETILEKWRGIAYKAGLKVSTFDLFASWIHMASILTSNAIAAVND